MAAKKPVKLNADLRRLKKLEVRRLKKAIADINQLVKTQKKLDLDLKKVKDHLKKMDPWQNFN